MVSQAVSGEAARRGPAHLPSSVDVGFTTTLGAVGGRAYVERPGDGVRRHDPVPPGAAGTAAISSDIDSLSKEISSVDTSDSAGGDAMVPITDADLASD